MSGSGSLRSELLTPAMMEIPPFSTLPDGETAPDPSGRGPLWRFRTIRVRRLFGMSLLLLAVMVAVEIMLQSVPGYRLREALWFVALTLYALAWCFGSCRQAGIPPEALLGRTSRPLAAKLSILALPLVGISLGMFWLLYLPLSYLFPEVTLYVLWEFNEKPWKPDAPATSAIDIVDMVILSPIAEEVFFRGVLTHRWAFRWGVRKAVFASAALFAILHVDVLGAFIFALVLTGFYVRTKSLLAPIACHVLNNAIAVALSFVPALGAPYVMISQFQADCWIGALGLTFGVLFLFMFRAHWLPREWTLPLAESPRETVAAAVA